MKNLQPLKRPIVLVHGSTANGSNLSIGPLDLGPYFRDIPQFLSTNGTEVHIAQLPTDASIAERAAVLKNFLETDMKGKMVNIIGHSIGGLDARYMVSVLKCMQVASITTIGTPHRGSPLADWAVKQIKGNGLWYWFFRLVGFDMRQRRFLPEITTSQMIIFNERAPNLLDVKYYSVATKSKLSEGSMSALLWLPMRWMEGQGHHMTSGGHDGMVPFNSQIWGTHFTTAAIDHLGQLNHHEFRFADQKEEAMQMWYNVYENLLKEGL